MTLLVDRLRSDPRSSRLIPKDADEAVLKEWLFERVTPVYEISNVAQYLAESGTQFARMEDFPNVAPPHILYWMEWGSPTRVIGDWLTNAETGATSPERVGLMVWQSGPPEDGAWEVACHAWGMWKRNKRAEPLVSWELVMHEGGFPEVRRSHIYTDIHRLFEQGRRPIPSNASVDLPEVESKEHARRLIAEAEADKARAEGKLDEVWSKWVTLAVLHPALMAHSLLACKNVSTETNHPPTKLSRRHQRETGEPLVTFKTLRIAPMGGGMSESSAGGHLDRSLHIVRGHFKTFTVERPLFGRLVGTYWWSSMLRGNVERGTVIKEYEVDAPAAPAAPGSG